MTQSFSRTIRTFLISIATISLVCFGIASPLRAQEPKPRATEPPQVVLKADTRLVVVNVVAVDHKGQPITDLEAQDFTVLEDGRAQKISSFSFQQPAPATASAPSAPLPPGVVSNNPPCRACVLNVLLFDSLNGELPAFAHAKDAALKYLDRGSLSEPIAIFVMQDKLTMLHDFTTDSKALRSAVDKYTPPAHFITGETTESRASAFATKGDYHTSERDIQVTLAQFHALARILAGYPGRKNVIWLSESFPMVLAPEVATTDSVSIAGAANDGGRVSRVPTTIDMVRENPTGAPDFSALVKKIADALMAAQVAVYPVDAAGLGKDDHLGSLHTMNRIADSTGGKAFYNRNDVGSELRAGLEDGSTYYTLSYYPENKNWDGKFRVINVRTTRPGVQLRYRLGYYALDPATESKDEAKAVAEDFSRALSPDAPAATAVLFQAGVVPPPDKTGKVTVNFAIDPHTLVFSKKDDGLQHAALNCVVWAYSGKGNPIRSEGGTSAALKPDVFQRMMQSYFPCQRTIDLNPGKYTLRLGVLDRTNNQYGTTTTEITVR